MSATLIPQLLDVVEEAVIRAMMESRTAIPGQVVGYRPHKAGVPEHLYVELGLTRQLRDGTIVKLPNVDRVPILWPGGAGFTSGVEPERGDEMLCIVSDRAIDSWLDAGGVQAPRSGRVHDISDIVALPGLRSAKNPVTVRRGRRTYYIGTDSGTSPWLRLNRQSPLSDATLEARTIHLGENSTLAVARRTDPTIVSQLPADLWNIWFLAIGVFTGIAPPLTTPISSILTGSTEVFSK